MLERHREEAATAPELFVADIDAAVRFFHELLGFDVWRVERGHPDGPAEFAVVALEESVVLIAREQDYAAMGGTIGEPRGAGVDIRIIVEDVDAMYRRVRDNGARIVHDIGDRYYGLRDFVIQDPWGFRWRFATALARLRS